MNCKKCGKEIPPDGLFCPYCGIRQERKPSRKRRGNGSGYAYQRGRTWTLRVTVGYTTDDTGKIHRVYRTKGGYPTKAEALRHVDELKGQQTRQAPTLSELWKLYKSGPYTKVSSSKQTAYKIAWDKMKQISHLPVDKLTIKDLTDCVSSKAPTYYPAKDMKTVLGKLWDFAMAEQYVTVRLPDFIELPTLEEAEPEPFSEIEIRALWNAYGDGDRFVGYILLMIYTGMMPGELLSLRQSMIDWNRLEIIGAGKKTSVRKKTPLVLADLIVPVLDDLCQNKLSTNRSDKVVGLNKDRFYKLYYESIERAGVRRLTPYSCRHTTATALALGNIAPSVIQQVMRHAKFSTTQRYIHPDTADMRKAVNVLTKGKDEDEKPAADSAVS